MSDVVLYATTDDEHRAYLLADALLRGRRKAIVVRVADMALSDPLTPRTADRFAILAEPARAPATYDVLELVRFTHLPDGSVQVMPR